MLAQKLFTEPEVYKIEVPFENVVTTETNVYVVRDQDDVLVVDLGAPTEQAASAVVRALSELGMRPDSPNMRYFLTHLHFDHSGLVDRLLGPSAELLINERALRAASPTFERRMSDYSKRRFQEEGMSLHDATEKAALIEISTPIDVNARNVTVTTEGDIIQVGRFGFQVIDLPGHTRGMQGLFQPDSGICFSGDQLLFVITPACGIFLDGEDSMHAYDRSMAKLMRLPIMHLYHSHGPIRADFRERASEILEKRARRLDEVECIVLQNPGLNGIETIRQIGWNIPFASIEECGQRQQWLIYTQGISLLDHLVATQRIRRDREPALTGEAPMQNTYRIA